jgi:SAM-dependent methyltransferase
VLNALPAFEAYKAHTWAALEISDGAAILDVACGTGFDLIAMAERWPGARFYGIDKSAGLLSIARSRAKELTNVFFVQGDGADLPFAAGRFDGVRIDRALQHMADPRATLAEMARATRAGGRIVAAEPDWGTYILYNGDCAPGEMLAANWRGSIRNPFIGRELAALLRDSGARGLRREIFPFATADYGCAAVVFDLPRVLARCVATGAIAADAAHRWREESEAAAGVFLAALNIVTVSGVVAR